MPVPCGEQGHQSAKTGMIGAVDLHDEVDAIFGPCLIPGCPGSVFASPAAHGEGDGDGD